VLASLLPSAVKSSAFSLFGATDRRELTNTFKINKSEQCEKEKKLIFAVKLV
jgi:hypothetical protein